MRKSIFMRMKKRNMTVFIFIAALLCFAGVVYATQSSAISMTDWEWAQKAGYISANAKPEQTITQAQFLQMVMTEYHAEEKGVVVPAGAENHWAAEYYATAKKEGIIGCSCQIKPEGTVTVEEAAKFVAAAVESEGGAGTFKK